MASTSPAALAAAGNTAYALLKTRAYKGRSVPCLIDASGNGVQLWIQALYQFMKSCDQVDGKDIYKVFFDATPETESKAVAAALSVLTLALSDQYYADCIDDACATDGETATAVVKLGDLEVLNIDHAVLFARATKLGALATLGKSIDDLEVEPHEYFNLDNSAYDTAGTFLDTVNGIYAWLMKWNQRMSAAGSKPTAPRLLSHMRIAVKKVCKELYTDQMISFTTIGGTGGMLQYLRRLANDKDTDGVKPSHAMSLPDLRDRPHAGRGRGNGRGNNYGRGLRGGRGGGGRGGGNRSDAPRGPKKKNFGGRKCHQCDSEYHLIKDCPQVPPKHQARGHALVMSNEFVHDFWKKGSGSTSKSKKTDQTLFVEDGYGGFTEFCG